MPRRLILKKAKIKDMRFMFNLYNYAVVNNFFNSKKKINYEDHKNWYLDSYKSKSIKIFICFLNKIRVGYIKFDIIDKTASKVSIISKKKYQKQGIASFMLTNGSIINSKISKTNYLYAEVKKKNKISQKFFLKNKFKLIKYIKKFNLIFSSNNNLYLKKL